VEQSIFNLRFEAILLILVVTLIQIKKETLQRFDQQQDLSLISAAAQLVSLRNDSPLLLFLHVKLNIKHKHKHQRKQSSCGNSFRTLFPSNRLPTLRSFTTTIKELLLLQKIPNITFEQNILGYNTIRYEKRYRIRRLSWSTLKRRNGSWTALLNHSQKTRLYYFGVH
jgi:hypothetical protein